MDALDGHEDSSPQEDGWREQDGLDRQLERRPAGLEALVVLEFQSASESSFDRCSSSERPKVADAVLNTASACYGQILLGWSA